MQIDKALPSDTYPSGIIRLPSGWDFSVSIGDQCLIIFLTYDIKNTEWLVTDVCHQPIFEKVATASRLSLAKTRKFCW